MTKKQEGDYRSFDFLVSLFFWFAQHERNLLGRGAEERLRGDIYQPRLDEK